MAVTFSVCDQVALREPKKQLAWDNSVARCLQMRVEAMSSSERPLVACTDAHPLALAAHDAFYEHRPLVLSPDAIWFCLAQGFAHHVALNAESLRDRFVRHRGKETLVVERPDFLLGQSNPWPEVFQAFSAQIADHIGKLRDLVVCDFSTTGPIERAASEVLLMDTFQPYFEYEMLCGCGIPSITLRGEPEDWRSIRRRASALSEFGLDAWCECLFPILNQFIAAAESSVDIAFWRSFFRYESGSGPSELTGWIHVLFPYLREEEHLVPNPYIARWEERLDHAERRNSRHPPWNDIQGQSLDQIPSGMSSAPVKFVDLRDDSKHRLRFVAGMFGVTQDVASGSLEPEFGWAVVHEPD